MPHLSFSLKKLQNMKIQATKSSIKSMRLCVPFDGIIEIDEKGVADVSAKCAVELVKNTSDWKYVGKSEDAEETLKDDAKEVKESETEKPVDETEKSAETEENGDEEDADELTADKLKALKATELRAMCEEAGFPEDEYKDLKKSELIDYLLAKLG